MMMLKMDPLPCVALMVAEKGSPPLCCADGCLLIPSVVVHSSSHVLHSLLLAVFHLWVVRVTLLCFIQHFYIVHGEKKVAQVAACWALLLLLPTLRSRGP